MPDHVTVVNAASQDEEVQRIYFMVKGKVEHVSPKEELVGKSDIFLKYLGVHP